MVDIAKKNAGEAACKFVKDGMVVGLGTGSTVYYAIMRLAEMIKNGKLNIVGIPTSLETEKLALANGIKLTTIDEYVPDVAIDGADEVDKKKSLIKGGGGALTREKIIDYAAKEFVVVVHESKVVKQLGSTFYLPVEVIPFGCKRTEAMLNDYFDKTVLRVKDEKTYVTDNGNYIIDCYGKIKNPKKMEIELNSIPGVVENGIFTRKVKKVVVGSDKGTRMF